MAFVVEIPSIFTKPTQIPVRLGNTMLTGNETIQGSLAVNGSLTLNDNIAIDNGNVVYYDSLDISNTLSVGGNATVVGQITTNELVINNININNKDSFFFGSTSQLITLGTNSTLTWNQKILGTNIDNNGFIASRDGLYSVTLNLYFGAGSTGNVRVGLKINGDVYRSVGTYLVSADSANRDVNMFTGNIIVNITAGQRITADVRQGTLRYYGQYSYMSGFYIGTS